MPGRPDLLGRRARGAPNGALTKAQPRAAMALSGLAESSGKGAFTLTFLLLTSW